MATEVLPPVQPDEPSTDPMVGRVLGGRYRLIESLGSGGVAVVYRAEDTQLARTVAVKVLDEALESNQEARGRFLRESRALAALTHPHIVNLIDFGLEGEQPFLVMELLEGQSLEDVLRRRFALPPPLAFEVTRQILNALAFAHRQGVLHRDLKPGNIWLLSQPAEHAKLLDFGLAKFAQGDARGGPPLTRAGTVAGTPSYMAPEQASGRAMDERTDVYAATAVLFEMLSGRCPFQGESLALLRVKLLEDPPTLGEVRPDLDLCPELESLLRRGLARDPANRFRDAAEMLTALDALPSEPVSWKVLPPSPDTAGSARGGLASAVATVRAVPTAVLVPMLLVPAFVVLLVCAGGLTWMMVGDEPHATSPAGPFLGRALGDEPESSAASSTGVPTPDPWQAEAVPPQLRAVHTSLEAGDDVDRATVRRLHDYARTHRDDARPHLLIGHAFAARNWYSDALSHYENAHGLDATSRGDPRMLRNLVRMAAHSAASERAQPLVQRIYGAEAAPAVDTALASGTLSPAEIRRLQRFREHLAP